MCPDKLAVPQIKGMELQTSVDYLTPHACTVSAFTPTSAATPAAPIWHVGSDSVS